MTSSLVGSEMCIRDSQVSDTNSNQPARKNSHWLVGHPFTIKKPGEPILGCLLYTSDAADDM
eukprot:2233522-Prorocentrum_lima.AAC.1